MKRHFETKLSDLKELILSMGGYVESAIEEATLGLIERDENRFLKVYEMEKKINQAQITIDDTCFRLLASQAPLAADLRFVISAIKINSDLERMGDQAINIVLNSKDFIAQASFMPLAQIEKMSSEVRKMVSIALDSFVQQNSSLAHEVLKLDDSIDLQKNEIFKELTQKIKLSPSDTEKCLDLILIARNLERLGDHSTNIAEEVIFISTGNDVRHKNQNLKTSSKA